MAFPDNNKDFSLGFAGYSTKGLVSLHSHWVGRYSTKPYAPKTGNSFLRIDDIRNIEQTDGTRLNPKLSQLNISYSYDNRDGTWTHSGDGAYLECQNVTIPTNEGLTFDFSFICGDQLSLGGNDFAVVLAYPNDNLGAVPSAKVVYDIRKLRANSPQLLQTDNVNWEKFAPWNPDPANGFRGTLRWVMMNGQIRSNPNDSTTPSVNARPSCLLIDFIDIV